MLWCSDFLAVSDERRKRAAIWFSVVEILLIGACIEFADLSDLLKNQATTSTYICIAILFPLVTIFVLGQKSLWFHDAAWNAKNQELAKRLEESETTTDFLTHFIEASSTALELKSAKIQKALGKNSDSESLSSISLPTTLQLLGLTKQLVAYPQTVATAFQPRIAHFQSHKKKARVRVTIFRKKDGMFRPLVRFSDGRIITEEDEVRSFKERPDAFKLEKIHECFVVASAYRDQPYILESTTNGHYDTSCPFNFLTSEQRDNTKSIVCFPIRFRGKENEIAPLVLCVDSNVEGFFSNDRKETYSILGSTMNKRFQYDANLDDLLKSLSLWVEQMKNGEKTNDDEN